MAERFGTKLVRCLIGLRTIGAKTPQITLNSLILLSVPDGTKTARLGALSVFSLK